MLRRQSTESQQGERKGILKTQLKYVKQESNISKNDGSFFKDSQNISKEGRGINGNSNIDNYDQMISEIQLKNASLKDLRPEDKRRVGQLMKTLAEEKQSKENLQIKIQQNSQEFKDKLANSQKEKQGILNDNLVLKEKLQEQINLLQQYQNEYIYGTQQAVQRQNKEVDQKLNGLEIYKLNSSIPYEGNYPKEGQIYLGKSSSISNQQIKQLNENDKIKAEQLIKYQDKLQIIKNNDDQNNQLDNIHQERQSKKRVTLEKKNGETEQNFKTWKNQSSFDSDNTKPSSKLFLKETMQQELNPIQVLHSKMLELTTSLQKISQNTFMKGASQTTQKLLLGNSNRNNGDPFRIMQGEVKSISQSGRYVLKENQNDTEDVASSEDDDDEEEEIQIVQRLLSLKQEKQLNSHQQYHKQDKEKQYSKIFKINKGNSQKQYLDAIQQQASIQQNHDIYNSILADAAYNQDYQYIRPNPSQWNAQENKNLHQEENDKSSNWKISKSTTHQLFEGMDKQQLERLKKQLTKRIKEMSQSKQHSRESVKHSALNTHSNIFELSNTQQLNSLKDSELLRYSHNTQSLSAPFSKSKDSFTSFAHPTKGEYYQNHGDIGMNRNQYELGQYHHPLVESQNQLNKSNNQLNYDNSQMIQQQEYQEQHPNEVHLQDSGKNTGDNKKNKNNFEQESLSSKERLLSKIEELTEEDLEQVMAVIKAKRNKRRIEKNMKKQNTSQQTEGEVRLRGSELSNSGVRNTDDSGMTKQIVKEVERQYFKEISKKIDQQLDNNEYNDNDDESSYDEEESQRYNEKHIVGADKQMIQSQNQEQKGYEMPQQMFYRILQEKNHPNHQNKDELDDANSSSNTSRSCEQKDYRQYTDQHDESPEETDRSINSIKRKINHINQKNT